MHLLVNKQISMVYDGRAQQLPCNALKILRQPIETVLQYLLASKQLWLESIQAAQAQ